MIKPLIDNQHKIFMQYKYLADTTAKKMKKRLPHFIDYRDLKSYGYIGLIDAIGKFDENRGVKFSTYAYRRIRGAIIDGLRQMDWRPRKAKEEHKNPLYLEDTRNGFWQNVSSDDRKEIECQLIDNNEYSNPESVVEQKFLKEYFIKAIEEIEIKEISARIMEKVRFVMLLYFIEHLAQNEISEILGISPSRVSQYIGEGKKQLKRIFMKNRWDG